MKNSKSFSKNLIHLVDLRIPGFYKSVPPGRIRQITFFQTSSEEWYSRFTARVFEYIGKKYYPVYRMADGEFIFCVGYKTPLPPITNSLFESLRLRFLITMRKFLQIKRSRTCWGENYSESEKNDIFTSFISDVINISKEGALAIHFTRTRGRFSEEYFLPMCDWFEQNGIDLTPLNHIPFYFIYALLNGPDQTRLYSGRRVLIITSFKNKSRTTIARTLLGLGAIDVQFLPISDNKTMMEKIDLSNIVFPVDLVLVAAGIGSANILSQLKPLSTVCIDAGSSIDYLCNTNLKRRDFCVPDHKIVNWSE